VESLDIVKYNRLCGIESTVCGPVDTLPLQHPEEALAGRIVATVTDLDHYSYVCGGFDFTIHSPSDGRVIAALYVRR
jgi:hypothetical protein